MDELAQGPSSKLQTTLADDRRRSSADKTLEILLALGELGVMHGGQVRLSAIIAHTGYPRPTVHRLLGDLRRVGFAEQDEVSGFYRLGPKILLLGAQCVGGLDLRRVAHPFLEELVASVGQTAHLGVRDGGSVVYIDKVEPEGGVRLGSSIGQRRDLVTTALGKSLLAFSPKTVVDEIVRDGLPKRTPRSIANPQMLAEVLERVRVDGFSLDNEECDPGVRCAAAPIFDHTGRVVSAISMSMLASHVDYAGLRKLGHRIAIAAAKVTERLSGSACTNLR